MDTQRAIEQLGYKSSEAKVYMILLQIGEATASYIASRVKLPRTSVLGTLEKLHKDGLVNFYAKKRYKYWIAEHPQRLLTILHEKEDQLKRTLPLLIALRAISIDKPTVHVFIGVDEIKQVHQDMIETKHHILAFLPLDEWNALLGEEYIDEFIALRTESFLQLRLLTKKTIAAERHRASDGVQLRQTKFMPTRIALHTATFIYDNKVAIITLNSKQPTGILIHDADISAMMRQIFEELWNSST